MPIKHWEDRGAFIIPAIVFLLLVVGALEPVLKASSLEISDWGSFLTKIETLVKVLAIILGGVWAYYKFIKGRVYNARLEPKVTGKIERIQGRDCLVATLQLKNVGASKVTIEESCRLDIFSDEMHELPEPGQGLDLRSVPLNDEPISFAAFSLHEWIESVETIEEEIIIVLGSDRRLFKLELHIDTARTTATAMTFVRMEQKTEAAASQPNITGWF